MGIRSVFTKVFSLPPSLPHTLPLYQGLPLSRTYQISLGHRVGFRLDLIHNSSSERLADDRARLNRQMMRIFLSLPSTLSRSLLPSLSLLLSFSLARARALSLVISHTRFLFVFLSLPPPCSLSLYRELPRHTRPEESRRGDTCEQFVPQICAIQGIQQRYITSWAACMAVDSARSRSMPCFCPWLVFAIEVLVFESSRSVD